MPHGQLTLLYSRMSTPAKTGKAGPWLGIAYLAAALEFAGFEVCTLEIEGTDSTRILDSLRRQIAESPHPVFLSCTSASLPIVLAALASADCGAKDRKVCLGGPGTLRLSRRLMESFPFLDAVAEGEGEIAAIEIARWFFGGPPPRTPNVVFRQADELRGAGTPLANDLWQRLWPYRKLAPHARVAPVAWGRGCDCACAHCVVSGLNGNLRRRNLADFVDTLRRLQSERGVSHFDLVDDYLGGSRRHIEQFCSAVEPLSVTWNCSLRTETADRELAVRMRSAGCRHVYIGLESGSESVRHALGKPSPLAPALDALRQCREFMDVTCSFIWGFPFESLTDFCRTLALMQELRAEGVEIAHSPFVPFPGSPLTQAYSGRLVYNPEVVPSALGMQERLPQAAQNLVDAHPELFTAFRLLPDPNLERKIRLFEAFQPSQGDNPTYQEQRS